MPRGGPIHWSVVRISEGQALAGLRAQVTEPVIPKAIDLSQLEGRPGYVFHLDDERVYWVDASTGAIRPELTESEASHVARAVVGAPVPIRAVEELRSYDTYYYARHGRERHLPVWRIEFEDPARSALYLDVVSGNPEGFVNASVRSWRWWREGLHSLDFQALNNKRPWWDLIVFPLMLGGTISAITGVWLLLRRLKRMARSGGNRVPSPSQEQDANWSADRRNSVASVGTPS